VSDEVPPNCPDAAGISGFSRLTPGQLSVLELVAQGLTNPQIGKVLHLSRYTVAQHIMEMCKRTGSANRTDLVNQAHLSGVFQ
jgi:DNA-binding NarL/FixJ family response regulator